MVLYEKSLAAENDWRDIITYTLDKYGSAQTLKYTKHLLKCMGFMAKGEGVYKDEKVLRYTVRIKHCQKHYIFGVIRDNAPMIIIAIFHEKMELMKRLKKRLK